MNPELTLYYDGNCPLCVRHVGFLRRVDRAGRLAFVDITSPGFDPAVLGTDMAAVNSELHSQRADGTVLTGVATICATFAAVHLGWMTLPLRTPLLRMLALPGYRCFARNRHRLSRLLGLRLPECDNGACRRALW